LTTYDVRLSETARRQFERLPEDRRGKVRKALLELKKGPYRSRPGADIKKLSWTKRDYYRLRIGSLRAIYNIDGRSVLVAKILPRSRAYDWIE